MTLSPAQLESLQTAAQPLLDWMTKNCHPHCKMIVDGQSVELMEGVGRWFTETKNMDEIFKKLKDRGTEMDEKGKLMFQKQLKELRQS